MTPTPITVMAGGAPDNTLAVLGLIVGAVGGILGVASFIYMMYRNSKMDSKELLDKIDRIDTRLNTLESRSLDRGDIYARLEDHLTRLVKLETKMGLFYGGVEELVPKMLQGRFNPIHLEPHEEEAYDQWANCKVKSNLPIETLRTLESAFDRELHVKEDIPVEEAMNVFFILQAVKAQLVDRDQHVVRSEYE